MVHSIRGDLSPAVRLAERAVALCHDWNRTIFAPNAMASLGQVYVGSERVKEGIPWLRQALDGHDSAGIGYFHAVSLVQAGEAYLLAGHVEDARACANRALTLTREHGERGNEAWALRLLGEVVSQAHQPDMATAEGQYGADGPRGDLQHVLLLAGRGAHPRRPHRSDLTRRRPAALRANGMPTTSACTPNRPAQAERPWAISRRRSRTWL